MVTILSLHPVFDPEMELWSCFVQLFMTFFIIIAVFFMILLYNDKEEIYCEINS